MWGVVTYIVAFTLTVPFVVTWLFYKSNRILKKTRIFAFLKAVNWTTILYILAVMMQCEVIFHHYYLGFIVGFFLVSLMAVILFQRIRHTEVVFAKACKVVWRFGFLLFSFLYICLVLYGIIQQLVAI